MFCPCISERQNLWRQARYSVLMSTVEKSVSSSFIKFSNQFAGTVQKWMGFNPHDCVNAQRTRIDILRRPALFKARIRKKTCNLLRERKPHFMPKPWPILCGPETPPLNPLTLGGWPGTPLELELDYLGSVAGWPPRSPFLSHIYSPAPDVVPMATQIIRGVKRGCFGETKNWSWLGHHLRPSSRKPHGGHEEFLASFDFSFAFSGVLIVVECSFKFWCNNIITNVVSNSFLVCFQKNIRLLKFLQCTWIVCFD